MSSTITTEAEILNKAFALDTPGVQKLLDGHCGRFGATVECVPFGNHSKALQFQGVVLGEMLDFWRNFDSFEDEAMYNRGEERPCTCEHAGHTKDEHGWCLETNCHSDDCDTGAWVHTDYKCFCDFAQCDCTWDYWIGQGGGCWQEWTGRGGGCSRGDLDDNSSVVGVWGLVDVVKNYQIATLEEARQFSNDDDYFRAFDYELNETSTTFTNKTNTIIQALITHQKKARVQNYLRKWVLRTKAIVNIKRFVNRFLERYYMDASMGMKRAADHFSGVVADKEEEDANHFVSPMNDVDEEDATTTGGDPGGSTDAAARARLHSFVDEAGNPICLKFAGYYWNNFHRVPPGKCRWGEECHLSHNPPSDDTKARLEELRRHHAKRKAAKEMATAKAEQAALNAPLPEWLHATRTTRVFECCRQGDEHDGKGGKSEDPWCRMQAALSVLLSLSVTDRPRKRTIVTEEQLEGLSLNQLHLCGELSSERVPLVPTLAHAFRLAGRKFPKSWTMAYKQTRSMIRLMTRQTAYENFIQAYEEFVREVIAPLAGVEEGNGLRYQCPPTLRVHMPGRAPVRAGKKGVLVVRVVGMLCRRFDVSCLFCFLLWCSFHLFQTIGMHRDADYDNHELGEINFWVPFTNVYGTNSLFCESSPDQGDFTPFVLDAGQGVRFNGNQCRHFTKPNETKDTRVSMDFRVIPRKVAVRPESFQGRIGDYQAKEMVPGAKDDDGEEEER